MWLDNTGEGDIRMFDTNMQLTFSMINKDGKVNAHIAVKDLYDDEEYEAVATGENVEEVLADLYDNLLDDIEYANFEDMTEDEYIDYLEGRIEELEVECETLREENKKAASLKKPSETEDIDKLVEKYFSKYFK